MTKRNAVRYEPTKCRTGRRLPKAVTQAAADRIQANHVQRLLAKPQATAVAEIKRWRKNEKRALNAARGGFR
jgi:hypothetical protein